MWCVECTALSGRGKGGSRIPCQADQGVSREEGELHERGGPVVVKVWQKLKQAFFHGARERHEDQERDAEPREPPRRVSTHPRIHASIRQVHWLLRLKLGSHTRGLRASCETEGEFSYVGGFIHMQKTIL